MKVNELSGALLDYWVSMVSFGGENVRVVNPQESMRIETHDGRVSTWRHFSPSTNWADGGPIIERERIELSPCFDSGTYFASIKPPRVYFYEEGRHLQFGPTPLVAAMRCYVASKFGAEVFDEVSTCP